ncbi:MAG: DNA replication and repair protein RecF [Saprospiraceae bacterium]|nr:DNA replication and repair protein RecF [Saprospiraceae bacterium]
MRIEKLKLVQFKNYQEQVFYFHERLNCLVGLNGMGKTNVLDAIHTLCMTRSKFTVQDRLLIHGQGEFYRLEADVVSLQGRMDHYVLKYAREGKKTLEKNRANVARNTDHVGDLPLVFYSPDDHLVLSGLSAERRKLLDQTISQSQNHYLQDLLAYNRMLKHRNALLQQFQLQQRLQPDLLDAVDHQMIPVARQLIRDRKEFADSFAPHIQEKYSEISGGKELVTWRYKNSLEEESLEEYWKKNRPQDVLIGRTQKGPHRDDWQVMMGKRSAARFASQGQMKTIMLAIRWAQWYWLKDKTGRIPFLLVDDLFDKLDAERISHFLNLIQSLEQAQVFVTYTHPEMLEEQLDSFGMSYKMFYIRDGEVIDEKTK